MSALEKTVFLADLTSADRDFPDLAQIHEALRIGIDQAMEYSIGFKIEKERAKGRRIAQLSLEAYNEYRKHEK
jgi:nicotinate-nucleotide adenylyltransferase